MLAPIDPRIEESRQDEGVLKEGVRRRQLVGAIGREAHCRQPRGEIFGVGDCVRRKTRPSNHMGLSSCTEQNSNGTARLFAEAGKLLLCE